MFIFGISTGEILQIDVDDPEEWGVAVFDFEAEDPTPITLEALQGYGSQGSLINLASVTPNDIHAALTSAGVAFAVMEGVIEYPAVEV